MPEKSFNIPAQRCKAGSHMVGVDGMICEDCYALKHRYAMETCSNAMENRYDFVMNNSFFVEIFTFIITRQIKKKFRWFDSGDIQDTKMLDNICNIARNTPHIKHWLPTKEWKIVKRYIYAGNKIPKNLTIRLSALKINGRPPTKLAKRLGLVTSTVVTSDVWETLAFKCPSSKQGNKCRDCEACWSNKVKDVSYKYH